jgi:ankyrin repeat protein
MKNLSDHLRSIEIFIDHDANVNATYTEQKQNRSFDSSVIDVATKHCFDRVETMRTLLAVDAFLNELDEEKNRIIVTACKYSSRIDAEVEKSDMMQLLLETETDLQYQNELNRTLLHHASQSRSNNFLTLFTLLIRDLDINVKDIYNRTSMHHACQNDK